MTNAEARSGAVSDTRSWPEHPLIRRAFAITPGQIRTVGYGCVGLLLTALALFGSNILGAAHTASDEVPYLTYAHNLLHGTYAVRSQEIDGLYLWHTPALPLLIAPLVALHAPVQVIRLTGPLLFLLSAFTFELILRRIVGRRIAALGGVALVLYWPLWRMVPQLFSEPLALLAALLTLLTLMRALENGDWRWGVAAGACAALLALTREEYGWLLLAVLVVSCGGILFRRIRRQAKVLALMSACALAFCSPWLAYTYSISHQAFYWTSSGGESLYWMTSPVKGETGSWFPAKQVMTDANLASHRPLYVRLSHMTQVAADSELKRIALRNIRKHPSDYLLHVGENASRILLGLPFSFQNDALQNLLYYGVPTLLVFGLAFAAWLLARRRRVGIPGAMLPALWLGLLTFLLHLPVAAYPRMINLAIPGLLCLVAFGAQLLLCDPDHGLVARKRAAA